MKKIITNLSRKIPVTIGQLLANIIDSIDAHITNIINNDLSRNSCSNVRKMHDYGQSIRKVKEPIYRTTDL